VAHQGEKAGDGKSFIAVTEDLEVDCVPIIEVREEGDQGVYGYHDEDADDVLLFPWFEVMRGMPPYHEQGNGYSYCAKRSRYDEAQMVESEPALP
jgi:hypothetical protein